ncbi:MAG: PqqD family protein [Bacteroidales bacterium]|jgi:hypothetical protein|nr:PqqD family protein [Bacteroidales bacterium]
MKEKHANLLDVMPCVGKRISTGQEGELSVITFPRFRNKFMQKYLVPKHKSPFIHIRLEKHGTAVWNLIDGRRTVRDIAVALETHFDGEKDYEYRIMAFLEQLRRQGFIKYLT